MTDLSTLPVETVPFFLSAALFFVLAVYFLKHQEIPGARRLAAVMAVDVWYVFSYAMDVASVTIESTTLWLQLKYFAVPTSTVLWLSLTLELTGHQKALNSAAYKVVWLWPIIEVLVVWTNSWHGLFWQDIAVHEGLVDSVTVHGPAFEVHTLVTLLLGFASLVLFVLHGVRAERFYRIRNLWLCAALLCPYFGYFFDLGLIAPLFARVDQVVLMFFPSAIFMAIAVYRYQLLDIVPIAQKMVFENLNSSILVVDPYWEVVAANQFALERWPELCAPRQLLTDVIHEFRDRRLSNGDQWEINLSSDGECYLVMVSELTSRAKATVGFALVLFDLTERRKVEHEAAKTVELRSQLLASISHELRSPLHAITGMLDKVLDDNLSDRQRSDLENAKASSSILLNLVNGVLDESRLQARQMFIDTVPFDLAEVLDQLQSEHSRNAEMSGVKLVISGDNLGVDLLGDPFRLRQVLSNLTSNAIKFSPAGSVVVKAEVEHDFRSSLEIRFTVKDTGIGIAAEHIDTLFEPFVQADKSITRRFGGSGLGLSIAESLVSLMGGHIEVDSAAGQGSSFSFKLTFAVAEPSVQASEPLIDIPELSRSQLLIVDDTRINLDIVETYLSPTKVHATYVSSGIEAVSLSAQHFYDLIFLDVHMPVMDGRETAKVIRSKSKNTQTPIIAMTASVLKEDRDLAENAGMSDFLPKPFSRADLFRVISTHLPLAITNRLDSESLSDDETPDITVPKSLIGENGDHGRYRSLVTELLRSCSGTLDTLSADVEQSAQLQSVHSLIGAAGLLGANSVSQSARSLERALQLDETPETLRRLTGDLRQSVERLKRFIRTVD